MEISPKQNNPSLDSLFIFEKIVLENLNSDWSVEVLAALRRDSSHLLSSAETDATLSYRAKPELVELAGHLAWFARVNGASILGTLSEVSLLKRSLEALSDGSEMVFLSVLYLQTCRYDAQYEKIKSGLSCVDSCLPTGFGRGSSLYFEAIEAFADALFYRVSWLRDSDAAVLPWSVRNLQEISNRAIDTGDMTSAHAVTATLEAIVSLVGTDFEPYANLLVKLTTDVIDLNHRFEKSSGPTYYRRGRAQEAKGLYGDAVSDYHKAIEETDPREITTIEGYHQRIEMARNGAIQDKLIKDRLESSVLNAMTQVEQTLERKVSTATSQIEGSLVRLVEILGVFLAIAGIVVTSISGSIQAFKLDEVHTVLKVVGFFVALSIPVFYFWLLRLIIRSKAPVEL